MESGAVARGLVAGAIPALVSLFSNIYVSDGGSGLITKMEPDGICKSLVFTLGLMIGIKLKTPLLFGPWLYFTAKNLITRQSLSVWWVFGQMPSKHFIPFLALYVMATCISLFQIYWWKKIFTYFVSLWVEVFYELFPIGKSEEEFPKMNTEQQKAEGDKL